MTPSDYFDHVMGLPGFRELFGELQSALALYWTTAKKVLDGGGVTLIDPPEAYFSLESNFFSAMFLYSYQCLEMPSSRRLLYGAINQCFRGMVTGCDNILDDEYKRTLETDLPAKAWRFRSVLDIMVSEHVMFDLLVRASRQGEIPGQLVLPAANAALQALTRSGVQEAGEEQGTAEVLPPEAILKNIHHYKTGVLFQSPWAVPAVIERMDEKKTGRVIQGLYDIGMGCQILDDLVDLQRDALQKRHNYIISLIYYHRGPQAWAALGEMTPRVGSSAATEDLIERFPEPLGMAVARSRRYLLSGINAVFGNPPTGVASMVISILARRIGAEDYLLRFP